ncbi:MAG: hypothetical protein LBG60_02280, partial [Bifidobacteriaceae bacterium]|nr:hypothetical protein [Bifidobacteriaceae bacterium]
MPGAPAAQATAAPDAAPGPPAAAGAPAGHLRRPKSRPSALLTPTDVRSLVSQLGLNPSKALGQHFVVDPSQIRRIVAAAQLTPGQRVLEVGPGLGSLTLGLLEVGADVTAVEIDPALADALPRTVAARLAAVGWEPPDAGAPAPGTGRAASGAGPASDIGAAGGGALAGGTGRAASGRGPAASGASLVAGRLNVVRADALKLDALPGPPPTALVANLPYSVAVKVLLRLLERFDGLA